MKTIKVNIKSESEMIKVGFKLGQLAYPNMVIAMNGNLGAGKTTLTKGIGQALGIKRVINSPTFTIMKIYEGSMNLYHLDVYRINNSSTDFDLEEYFYLGGVSVIEWAENIEDLLPKETLYLDYIIEADTSRTISFTGEDEFIEKLVIKLGE
jgi:tRNA threonylcarbamoyladenosine biosynthesis protein TsaE